MALVSALFEILQRPTIWDVLIELMIFMAPLWIAVFIGVMVGWAWKPNWANLAPHSLSSPSKASGLKLKLLLSSFISWIFNTGFEKGVSCPSSISISDSSCSSHLEEAKPVVVGDNDLDHLCRLVEEKDDGPAWIHMMDRSTPTMSYQAWRRDPENGAPQYRSSTVFEDATPEMVRDFFWDDDFRLKLKWDDMLVHAQTLEECPTTGTMIVQWERKFPFFCSNREYIIGRRIWESKQSYYCVTKVYF
ncbi:hypothetical protein CsSME_00007836 [Camellia sinensis var. sinensis]